MQLLEVGSSKAANVFCWLRSLESQTATCGQRKAFTFRTHLGAFCIAIKSDERYESPSRGGKIMTKKKDADRDFGSSDCSSAITRLTDEQRLELAACYAEYCGVDPEDKADWRHEMVGAKKFVREVLMIWKKREKDGKSQ